MSNGAFMSFHARNKKPVPVAPETGSGNPGNI
jgi:hypothetical protein